MNVGNKWLIPLILLMSSCSAQWHLKTAIKKDPTIVKQKVITVVDTVVTEPIVVRDTVTLSKIDTVEIVKDKFRVKIMRSFDTLIIDGGCEADTIYKTIEVPVDTVVYQEREKWYHKVYEASFYILVITLIALIAFLSVSKRLRF